MRITNTFIFIEGVGEVTERRLWERGITDWEAFNPEVAPGLGPVSPERIEDGLGTAQRALEAGDSRFFEARLPPGSRWRLYEDFRRTTCFLDIETTGLDPGRDVITTVSIHRGGETDTLVRGRDLEASRLRECLGDARLLATFNGARFDVPFLERDLGLELDMPHLDLMYPCRNLGLTGGLKRIEADLGIDRPIDDVDGREAVRLWHRYEAGDERALDRLIRYNRLDASNLEPLAEAVVAALDREVFEPYRPSG